MYIHVHVHEVFAVHAYMIIRNSIHTEHVKGVKCVAHRFVVEVNVVVVEWDDGECQSHASLTTLQ